MYRDFGVSWLCIVVPSTFRYRIFFFYVQYKQLQHYRQKHIFHTLLSSSQTKTNEIVHGVCRHIYIWYKIIRCDTQSMNSNRPNDRRFMNNSYFFIGVVYFELPVTTTTMSTHKNSINIFFINDLLIMQANLEIDQMIPPNVMICDEE